MRIHYVVEVEGPFREVDDGQGGYVAPAKEGDSGPLFWGVYTRPVDGPLPHLATHQGDKPSRELADAYAEGLRAGLRHCNQAAGYGDGEG